jgi:glutamyl-tRNA synthetase
MGWPEPTYAHVPLIPRIGRGQDVQTPRRHRRHGLSPARLPSRGGLQYLLRLGWGHGDEEIISREDAIRCSILPASAAPPSRFDTKKLENLNGHYLREASDGRLAVWSRRASPPLIGRSLGTDEIVLLTQAMRS